MNADPHLWVVVDPEIARTNPVEDKHRRLVRSHRSGPLDRELKPNAKLRDDLNVRPKNTCGLGAATRCNNSERVGYSQLSPHETSQLRR